MSIESMTMVMIAGPEKMGNTAVENLVMNKAFHPISAINTLAETAKLQPLDSLNPYSEHLTKACDIARTLDIPLDYRDFNASPPELDKAGAYVGGLTARLDALGKEKETRLKEIESKTTVCKKLSRYEKFDVTLYSLFNMHYQKFRFGRIPNETYKECLDKINELPGVYFVPSIRSGRWVYGAYFALPNDFKATYELIESYGFERVRIDVEGNVETTAIEVYRRLLSEIEQAEKRVAEIDAEYQEIRDQEQETLLLNYSWLRFMSDSVSNNTCAGRREGKFYILGWIPSSDEEEYLDHCAAYDDFGCFLTPPEEVEQIAPPVKMKKGFLSTIYEPFVEMFGLPKKGEVDPRLMMLITYTLLFGIMFGDAGQGLLLIVVGVLLWKLKNIALGRIIAMCGLSATLFGYFLYGSIFGDEEIIPGFHVLEGGNTMTILMGAVVLGIVLICICMVLNMITGIRQKNLQKILFSPNGLAGFVLYMGLAGGVMLNILKGINLFTTPFILLVIVLPVLLIYAGSPLAKLLSGQKDWKPESVGMFFVEGFFELFETALAYLSNTLSFLRVGAFAISHAGMMMVVYLLSAHSGGGYSIGGLIFGNLFITLLESVLVCIQVMRLHYYEMFGRFYESGGVKFAPKTVDYKAAD